MHDIHAGKNQLRTTSGAYPADTRVAIITPFCKGLATQRKKPIVLRSDTLWKHQNDGGIIMTNKLKCSECFRWGCPNRNLVTDECTVDSFKTITTNKVEKHSASDRGMVEEIIINLKRVEQDYRIDLTNEMEWLRNIVKKGE